MPEICPHAFTTDLTAPRLSHSVHREECTLCFDDQDHPDGVDVCLTCFNGGCPSLERHHARSHYEKSSHPLVVNVKRVNKPVAPRDDNEPPAKKLAILEEREEDKYDQFLSIRCYACGGIEVEETPQIKGVVTGIMKSSSSNQKAEVKAWEEEIVPCEHTLLLNQEQPHVVQSTGATCSSCSLSENLWLCLTCGSLGCGRPQFGGTGGNGHGVAHFDSTGHPLAVKLGTITAEGNADIYCYQCNDAKLDPSLAQHLNNFGINVLSQTKTEKSMTELQIEHNLKFDFSMVGEDGKDLQPLFGPGLTGLKNLGNSCYLASTLQMIFSLPAFQFHYLEAQKHHSVTCQLPPDSCIDCQMRKVGDGLLSGRYSQQPTGDETWQNGIKPTMLKSLVGKGHEEFSTMKQQDAEEFFQHLVQYLRNAALKNDGKKPGDGEPTDIFRFGMEQKLKCTECGGVRIRTDELDSVSLPVDAVEESHGDDGKIIYQPVALEHCLSQIMTPEEIEYSCPQCKKNVKAFKQSRFATFPDVLLVHMKKFQLINWVPQKLEIPVNLPEIFDLSTFLAQGILSGEKELPEDSPTAREVVFNEAAMSMLQGMGFPEVRCHRALLATGNSDGEAAMEWLFGHMDDPDIDDPVGPAATSSASDGSATASSEPSGEQIAMLQDMGFNPNQARKAFRISGGDADAAVEWLFSNSDDPGDVSAPALPAPTGEAVAKGPGGSSTLPATYKLKAFISHKGPSVHSGHYVATVNNPVEGVGSVLFNDEKVVQSDGVAHDELQQLAYIYVFERNASS